MVTLKKACKLNPFDLIAAKRIRAKCGGGWINWRQHVRWWFGGGCEKCWFAVAGIKRVAYVRVDKGGYVSIAVLEGWRGAGLGEKLLREMRARVDGMLLAVIHKDNRASRAIFLRAGYSYMPTPPELEQEPQYLIMKNGM